MLLLNVHSTCHSQFHHPSAKRAAWQAGRKASREDTVTSGKSCAVEQTFQEETPDHDVVTPDHDGKGTTVGRGQGVFPKKAKTT